MLPTGQGGGASHQRGNAFPRPPGRLYGFRRQRRHKKWRRGRRTSPAQRYYIPPEGESPQPTCKAKPITGRTLAAQGQRPGGWLNPHARKGVSTYGNTGKHRAGPDPDRAERRLNLHTHKGIQFLFPSRGQGHDWISLSVLYGMKNSLLISSLCLPECKKAAEPSAVLLLLINFLPVLPHPGAGFRGI